MRPYDEYENVQNVKPKFTPESSVPIEEPIPCGIRAAIARLKARAETNQQYLVRISKVLNGFPRDYFEKDCEPDKSPDDACPIMTLFDDIDHVVDGDNTDNLLFCLIVNYRHSVKVVTFEHVSNFFLVVINCTGDKVTIHNIS